MNSPTDFATVSKPVSDFTARRRTANRRLGWSLAVVAVLIFLITLFLRS